MTDPFAPLLAALRTLKAQSDDGFEGLMRDALQIICGRTLRLVRSGPQAGKDILADAHPGAPGVAIEAKRFAANTPLPLDELKSKLRESIDSMPGLDIWVLAYSGEMVQPNWQELERIGAERGVSLLCLDWRSAPGSLPVIAAVCAAAPHIVEARLQDLPSGLLSDIQAHPEFQAITDRVRQALTAPDAGFDLAVGAASAWLRESVSSRAAARERLRNHAELLSPDAPLIERPTVARDITQWWQASPRGHAVLLGDEGRGKTWAAIGWCLRLSETEDAPLILPASAKDVPTGDAATVLGSLLDRCIPAADPAILARRFRRWALGGSSSARILLVVDGLNEQWSIQWGEFIRLFEVEPWKSCVRILLTCRTGYWRDDLSRLQGAATEPITEIKVREFSDPELEAYLAKFGLERRSLSQALLNLIRIPRFAALAIALKDKLQDSEDLTVGRLVLEDWRARLDQRGTDLRVDDEGLLRFVASLGRDALQDSDFRISEREIHERLSADSGRDLNHYRNAINEVVEGLWLKTTERPHEHKVNEALLPYAIGLDLASSVEALADRQAVEDVVARYEEQLRGADIGVSILRAATSVSFARQKSTPAARAGLFTAWVRSQNFSGGDFAEMWPLVTLDPDLVLDIAEAHWREHPVGRREGEIFAKAFANADKWPKVHQALVARLPKWAGAFGWDPLRWGHSKNIQASNERETRTRGNFDEWQSAQAAYPRPIASHLCPDEKDYLAQAALCIISYLPRAPFIETLIAFAVTRAIMGPSPGSEQFEWLLRLNPQDHDALEADLTTEMSALKRLGTPVALRAADLIVDALATPEALSQRSEPAAALGERALLGWPRIAEDHQIVCTPAGPGAEIEPLTFLSRLGSFATDPDAILSTKDSEAVREISDSIPADPSWFESFPVQHRQATISMARWAPQQLGSLIRRLYSALPDWERKSLSGVTAQIEDNVFLLGPSERRRLLEAFIGRIRAGSGDEENQPFIRAHQALVVAGLTGETASTQIETLRQMLPDFAFSANLAELLAKPSAEDLRRVFQWLAEENNDRAIISWLGYLRLVAEGPLPPEARVAVSFTRHENEAVREAAIQMLLAADDPVLGKAFADSEWTHQQGQNRVEAVGGTYLLARFGGHIPFDDLRGRIVPQALALLAQERGSSEAEVRAVFEYVNDLLDEEINGKPRSRYGYGHVFEAPEVWRKVALMEHGIVIGKTHDAVSKGHLLGFFNIFPLIELLGAIIDVAPKDGAEIWKAVRETQRRNAVTVGDFNLLAFVKSDDEHIADLRRQAIEEAKNDKDLADAVYRSLRHGHEAWLISLVRDDLAHTNAGRVARGLTLAGFLNNTDAAEELWSETIIPLDLDGWLSRVRADARSLYERNMHARHWFESYFKTTNHDEAYGCLRLCDESTDARWSLWAHEIVKANRDKVPHTWIFQIDSTSEHRSSRLNRIGEGRRKTLFFTRILTDIAPWL